MDIPALKRVRPRQLWRLKTAIKAVSDVEIKLAAFLLLFSAVFLSPACAAGIEVQDDNGRQVKLDGPAQRIVSLSPHATELLFAAGAGAQVVGVASYSNYPPEAQQRLEIGGSESLNLEAIIALQPDLVVAWKSGNVVTQVERLIKLGIPVFYSEPRQLNDIATNLERLGIIAGTSQVAGPAAQAFRHGYQQIGRHYSQRAPVNTFYQIWHQPLMTLNGKHLISQVIELCGGRNIFSDLKTLASTVNREAVLAADPQIIIASGRAGERPQWLQDWRTWPQISAVRNHQLYFIEPDLIQRQTPRILRGAKTMCEQIEQARKGLLEGGNRLGRKHANG